MEQVTVVRHPAVADRLARLRDATTPMATFRKALEELGGFLAYEATRSIPTRPDLVATPHGNAWSSLLGEPPVIAPILRAGLAFVPGFLSVNAEAIVAHLGFFRDPASLEAVAYYANLPDRLAGIPVFALDPMLATGHSASAALDVLEAAGAANVVLVCAIAAPEGVAHLAERHPTARIVTAALDEALDHHGYIVPGLGDAGDRMFGSLSSLPVAYRGRPLRNGESKA